MEIPSKNKVYLSTQMDGPVYSILERACVMKHSILTNIKQSLPATMTGFYFSQPLHAIPDMSYCHIVTPANIRT